MKNIFLFIVIFFVPLQTVNAQWTEQFTGDTVILKSVSAVDNNIAWVSGDIQRIYRTTNGGTNWVRRPPGIIPYPLSLSNVFAVDENLAFVSGYNYIDRTFVYRTSNGGASWTQVFSQLNGFVNSVWMISPTDGFIMGDPVNGRWSLWRTSNGGTTWDSSGMYLHDDGGEFGTVNCLYVYPDIGQTSIWFGTNNYRVYHSTNSGMNWTSQLTPTSQYIYSIWFNSLTNGMRGGSGIYFTSNSGLNWNQTSSLISNSGMTGEGNKWWSVQYGSPSIFYSSNNGTNWSTQFYDTAIQFTHITIPRNHLNQYSVWAIGNPGKIYRLNSMVGVQQISNEIFKEYYISHNYTNPFNPTTKINFEIPLGGFVKINIYNLLGKEIKAIVNEYKNAGKYEIEFVASDLTSGDYFYKIETDNFKVQKKMILLK